MDTNLRFYLYQKYAMGLFNWITPFYMIKPNFTLIFDVENTLLELTKIIINFKKIKSYLEKTVIN